MNVSGKKLKTKKHRFLSAFYSIKEVSITYHPFAFEILP